MFSRIILNIKHRSNDTLRAWSYQCESILAQRSRRIQQLFTFYHRVYGPHGLKQLLRSYHRQLQPPLRGMMMSAVGAVGLAITNTAGGGGFDWPHERLSLANFDLCSRDIEFIQKLPHNKLCSLCKDKHMKYCYCTVGNKKCRQGGQETMKTCNKSMNLDLPEKGKAIIEAADEVPWEPYLSKNQFSIWRREERSGMYSYKVYARFDDITAADMLQVQTDLNYRKQWDETAVTLEVVESDPLPDSNSHLIYWVMRWPKFFANRDYVYSRRFVTDYTSNVIMICSRGTKHPKFPPTSDKVRVLDYWSLMVIKPFRSFREPGLHYMLTYYDDPGLSIPQSIKSWVTQKQMPDFLEKVYAATKQYACKATICEMKQMGTDFNITDDYTANEDRTGMRTGLRKNFTPRRESEK